MNALYVLVLSVFFSRIETFELLNELHRIIGIKDMVRGIVEAIHCKLRRN